jgi:uncharacterized protein (TIGR03437 family)
VRVGGIPAPLLYVSPGQINFQIPAGLPAGEATVTITAGDGTVSETVTRLAPVSPGLFAADFQNKVPVGTALKFRNGVQIGEQPLVGVELGTGPGANPRFFPARIDPGQPGDEVYLVLFGTGIRGRGKQEDVKVLIGGTTTPVVYADDQKSYAGLDQINVRLPDSLIGLGRLELAISIQTDGPDGLVLSNSLLIDVGSTPSLISSHLQQSMPSSARPIRNTPSTREGALVRTQITGLSPSLVEAGSLMTITGTGFNPQRRGNTVRFGSVEALIEEATSTELKVRVPYDAKTGIVSVRNSLGQKLSENRVEVQTSLSGVVINTENKPIGNLRVELLRRNLFTRH